MAGRGSTCRHILGYRLYCVGSLSQMTQINLRPLNDEEYAREEDYACCAKDCRERPSHQAIVKLRSYWRERLLCPYHADKFAKRHKIEFKPQEHR